MILYFGRRNPERQQKGFQNIPELVCEGVPQEVFFALPFTENVPKGIVLFHEGFSAKANRGYNDGAFRPEHAIIKLVISGPEVEIKLGNQKFLEDSICN